jgi:hypothetical protein
MCVDCAPSSLPPFVDLSKSQKSPILPIADLVVVVVAGELREGAVAVVGGGGGCGWLCAQPVVPQNGPNYF